MQNLQLAGSFLFFIMKRYKLSKEAYYKIKQMNISEMEILLGNVFQQGYNEKAKSSNTEVTPEDLCDAIKTLKGIGEQRIADIRYIINKVFSERSGKNE